MAASLDPRAAQSSLAPDFYTSEAPTHTTIITRFSMNALNASGADDDDVEGIFHLRLRDSPAMPLPDVTRRMALCRARSPLGDLHTIVVHIREHLVGGPEPFVEIGGRRIDRVAHDLVELPAEMGVLLARGIIAQVGPIGSERSELVDRVLGIDQRHRRGLRRAARAFARGILADDSGVELDLEVSIDDLLAGLQIFRASDIALDDVDEFVV